MSKLVASASSLQYTLPSRTIPLAAVMLLRYVRMLPKLPKSCVRTLHVAELSRGQTTLQQSVTLYCSVRTVRKT